MLCTGNKHLNVKHMSNKSNQVADLEARSVSLKEDMKIHGFGTDFLRKQTEAMNLRNERVIVVINF